MCIGTRTQWLIRITDGLGLLARNTDLLRAYYKGPWPEYRLLCACPYMPGSRRGPLGRDYIFTDASQSNYITAEALSRSNINSDSA